MYKDIKSKCCKAELKVEGGDEGTSFYRCLECGKPADLESEESMKTKNRIDEKVEDEIYYSVIHKDCGGEVVLASTKKRRGLFGCNKCSMGWDTKTFFGIGGFQIAKTMSVLEGKDEHKK